MTNLKSTWTVSENNYFGHFFGLFCWENFSIVLREDHCPEAKRGGTKKTLWSSWQQFSQQLSADNNNNNNNWWQMVLKKGHAIARRFISKLWNWASLSSRKQSSGSLFINPAISAPRLNNFRTTVINGFCQLKSNVLYLPQGNSADGVGQEINSVWSWLRGSRFNSSSLLTITPSYAKLS